MKEIVKMFNLSGGAQKKEVLFNRIRVSPHVTKIGETEFEYHRPKTGASSGGKKIPTWILLLPEQVPLVDGIDMVLACRMVSLVPQTRRILLVGHARIS